MSRLGVPQLPGRPCLSAHDTFPSCKISYQCQFADLRVNLLAPHFTDHSLHHHHAQVTLIFGTLIFGTLIPGTLIPELSSPTPSSPVPPPVEGRPAGCVAGPVMSTVQLSAASVKSIFKVAGSCEEAASRVTWSSPEPLSPFFATKDEQASDTATFRSATSSSSRPAAAPKPATANLHRAKYSALAGISRTTASPDTTFAPR